MPGLALTGYVVFLLLAFGVRTAVHHRRTGRTGFAGISGRVGSAEWVGGGFFVVALVAGALAPLLQWGGWLAPVPTLDRAAGHVVGAVLYALGTGGTVWAQLAMGDAWRIGVDAADSTDLVADGPFRWVRNPIFTSMSVATLGLVLIVPNRLAIGALLALLVALELQVRRVEEPYLVRAHGDRYRRYAAHTGRFVPGLGRLASGGSCDLRPGSRVNASAVQ